MQQHRRQLRSPGRDRTRSATRSRCHRLLLLDNLQRAECPLDRVGGGGQGLRVRAAGAMGTALVHRALLRAIATALHCPVCCYRCRFPLRLVLAVGMMGAAICVALVGATYSWRIRSPAFIAVVWAANGLLQSVGWPAVVAVMGNWFGRRTRGMRRCKTARCVAGVRACVGWAVVGCGVTLLQLEGTLDCSLP